ncbi:hypothetical protein HOLleu_04727 [Holothuria leucospilota]|uniref:Tyrosine-protein kinase ephrin type A/B receptor-like domain-containing protein n=1 Tax=Holothuria leucospilota TaxID=206669 RepID=A0A9Q1CJZ8_HOLLE|nr:hypothetical protein HOLleu_04727 [Holothuria leucospilota]
MFFSFPFSSKGGFYQDEIGVIPKDDEPIGCKKCPPGKYVKNGTGKSEEDCLDCPAGTNTTLHAGYRACFCKDNYARTERFGPCSICNEKGIHCSWKEYRSIKPDFFWSWNFSKANVTNYRKFVENLKTENWMFDSFTQYDGGFPRAFQCPKEKSCVPTRDHIKNLHNSALEVLGDIMQNIPCNGMG